LAYQIARSFKNNEGDFAASSEYRYFTKKLAVLGRTRLVGKILI